MAGHFITHNWNGDDHNGVAGSVEDNLVSFDASEKLKDSGITNNFIALPEKQTYWHWQSTIISGNPLKWHLTGEYPYNSLYQFPAAQNDEWIHSPRLFSAGTYLLIYSCAYCWNRGICSFYLDDLKFGEIDGYDARIKIILTKISGISITAGMHTLKGKMEDKNDNSNDYYFTPTKIDLIRTGD